MASHDPNAGDREDDGELAESHHWSILRLRATALVLTLAMAMVALRSGNPWLVLWLLPVLPLFWSADVRLSEMMVHHLVGVLPPEGEALRLHDPHHHSARMIQVPSHRGEFYALLALATMVVVLR